MRYNLIGVLIMSLCFSSCPDGIEPPFKPDFYEGELNVEINGVNTELCVYGKYLQVNGRRTIGILGDIYTGHIRIRHLNITLPDSIGLFPIFNKVDYDLKQASLAYFYIDEDVGLADFSIPLDNPNGFIEITYYDPVSKKIEGNVNGIVYLKENHALTNPPDSLIFTNGVFSTFVTR